jgi:hypothetical protein
MALTAEDGSGISGANSPNSIAELDALCAADPRLVGWAQLTDSRKEAAAILASRDMEREYRDRLTGQPVNAGQGLSFPRSGSWDARGRTILSTSVPEEWKLAHAHLSYRVAYEEQAPVASVAGVTEDYLFDLVQPVGKVLVRQGW